MRTKLGIGLFIMLIIPTLAWCKIGGGDVTYRPSGADTVIYSHDTHLQKGLRCSDCHYALYSTTGGHMKKVTMQEMDKGQSCGACHNGQKAFDVKDKNNCKKCHK